MANGLLSKGITLGYKTKGGTGSVTNLPGLQSIPSLGGSPDKVDITTLADGERHYINGVKDYGDLAFKFLYIPATSTVESNYEAIKDLEESSGVPVEYDFEVGLADGSVFEFSGTMVASLDEAEVNAALTFTLSVGLTSAIELA